MKRLMTMFAALLLLVLMFALPGIAFASVDEGGPPGIMAMADIDYVLADVAGYPAVVGMAKERIFDTPSDLGRFDKRFDSAVVGACNHKSQLVFGHLGGVSMDFGSPMTFLV